MLEQTSGMLEQTSGMLEQTSGMLLVCGSGVCWCSSHSRDPSQHFRATWGIDLTSPAGAAAGANFVH